MPWQRILGHAEALDQIRSAHRKGRLGHAYLFVGPDGVGKKTFALELAKAMLCESPPELLSSCGQCASCSLVDAGTHPDLIQTRKPEDKLEFPIEVIRVLIGDLGMKPVRGKYRIAIVEDADDFNEESANAFLKSLEEPADNALLILIATSTDRQLPTILSRCQVLRFNALSNADLRNALLAVEMKDPEDVKKKTPIPPELIEKLLRLAGGSVGRALALSEGDVWNFRREFWNAFDTAKPDSVSLGRKLIEFAVGTTKDREAAQKRSRAAIAVQLGVEMLQTALRASVGTPPTNLEPTERSALNKLQAIGTEKLLNRLESCLNADFAIDRRVNVEVLLEQFADRLTR